MGIYLTIAGLVLRLILMLTEMSRDRSIKASGYAEAVKDALEQAHRDLAEADAARYEAEQAHVKDKTDDAFLPDFKRD